MSVIPVMHRSSGVRTTLRRGLTRKGPRVLACLTAKRLDRILSEQLVDAVVVDVRDFGLQVVHEYRATYPGIPMFAMSAFRPDDGRLIGACFEAGVSVLLEGLDDGVAGEMVGARSASRVRRRELAAAPKLLRLTEDVQLRAWEEVLMRVGRATSTSDIAVGLGVTREHLSREFAAGGAPNLKRVIDLTRVVWAADLLKNPGYDVRSVSRILQFSSPGHLAGTARRVVGVALADLAALDTKGLLRRFVRGRMRSRL